MTWMRFSALTGLHRRAGVAAGTEDPAARVTTLARLVASVVTDMTRQLWEELAALPDPVQRRALDRLLDVLPGSRLSDLERWRKGPAPRGSGPSLVKSLDRVAEIGGLGLAGLGGGARVPPRRLAELSRYGMTASASLIRRHFDARRLATLLATVRHLEARSIDDALELLDLLMTTELRLLISRFNRSDALVSGWEAPGDFREGADPRVLVEGAPDEPERH
jgi:hypothetical protein